MVILLNFIMFKLLVQLLMATHFQFPSWATADMLFELFNKYGYWRIQTLDWVYWGMALYNGIDKVDNRVIIIPVSRNYVTSKYFILEKSPYE